MSANYAPVLWNRQKKIYDRIMLGLILLYLILFIVSQVIFFPEITAETLIIRATGTLAFLMLHVILCIGPLARLNNYFLPLLYNRRHLGVAMFIIALVHGFFNIIMFHALGNADPLVSLFTANGQYDSFVNFPFQILGFFALLILFLMAVTSHDFWLKNLNPKVWKSLHILVYVAYFLLMMHVLLGIIQMEKSIGSIGVYATGMITVIGLHLASAIKEKNSTNGSNGKKENDFVEICSVEEIANDRAKIVMINNENIAVYKHDGKISAVNNICRHQHGPLGEGKIVDGCIVCPWHGYQYLPHNGQSPAPFTEKLETYDVKIVDGKIYVNPKPYPEGTERPPAVIGK